MNKKTLIILGVIAVLGAAIVLQRTVHFSSVPAVKPWNGTADEILIKKGTAPEVRLSKKDGVWFVGAENYPAESSIVDSMIKKLDEFTLIDLVTKKEFYERFDLSDDRASRVTVKGSGKVLRDILIGKKSGSGDSSYVKYPDKKEVYLAGGSLAFELGKDVEGFRAHTILKCPIESIETITVKNGAQTYTVVRTAQAVPAASGKEEPKDPKKPAPASQDTWSLAGSSAEINQAKVRDFAGEFGNVSAQSFIAAADVAKKTGTPRYEITIKSGGKDIVFKIFGKEGTDGYICYSSENPWHAVVSKFKAENLMKSLKDFQAK
jgi:hypothetical protein